VNALPPRNHFGQTLTGPKCDATDPGHASLLSGRFTGSITLRIEVLSPVLVGIGEFEPHENRLVRAAATRAGVPVIPGSSLKGACRQVFESLTDSDSPFDRVRHASPSGASALFGRLGHQGRAGFDDALPLAPVRFVTVRVSVPYPPQAETGRRFYGLLPEGAQQERVIPAQALPTGACLETHLRVRNASREELGGILVSLGVEAFVLRLGGGKYDGYGCVRVSVIGFALREGGRSAFTPARREGEAEALRAAVRAWRDAFFGSPHNKTHFDELCRRLVAPEAPPC
jgi:hypothetical protein